MFLKKDYLQYLGLILVALLIFLAGYYYGWQNQKSRNITSSYTQGIQKEADSKDSQNTPENRVLEVSGVKWIHPGEEPICPNTHPIKGTFNSDSGNFYTKENSRYDRIKADICFASEEFARDEAGFIKKF